jgi:hypothetical protein
LELEFKSQIEIKENQIAIHEKTIQDVKNTVD